MTKRKSMMLAGRLGKSIAARRKQLGLTQDQLAERVAVDAETISRFERGVSSPSLATLEALSMQLEITIAQLLDEDMPKPIEEAQVISSLMSKMKGKDRKFLLEMIRLYCERYD